MRVALQDSVCGIQPAIDSVPWDNVAEDLEELLRKKLAGLKQDDPYKKKAALGRFAAARGFGFSESEKVLGKLKFKAGPEPA